MSDHPIPLIGTKLNTLDQDIAISLAKSGRLDVLNHYLELGNPNIIYGIGASGDVKLVRKALLLEGKRGLENLTSFRLICGALLSGNPSSVVLSVILSSLKWDRSLMKTLLVEAAHGGNVDLFKMFFQLCDLGPGDELTDSSLSSAACGGSPEMVKYLLEQKAQPQMGRLNPLSFSQDSIITKILIDAGATENPDNLGMAVQCCDEKKISEHLLKGSYTDTEFEEALKINHHPSIRAFIASGTVPLSTRNRAITESVKTGNKAVFSILIGKM